MSTAGDEAIEIAALAGLYLDDWQQFVLRNALGERPDGKWSAPTVGLVVGRQNGKGSILEARELWGLFMGGERLILHTAHEQKTATNHFRRLLALIEDVPEFARRVKSAPRGKGSEAIELHGGAMIFFSTRTGGGGRGLTADCTVYDEAMHLSEDERSALSPTKAALSMHGNTQSWYVGSAVDRENPKHNGMPLAQVRLQGIAGHDRVAFFEWSAPGDDPGRVSAEVAGDPLMWAQANPGLAIRISHEYVEHERTVELGARGFAVERLGVGAWPDPTGDSERIITRAAWAATVEVDASKRIVGTCFFSVDCSPDDIWGSISVAGRRDDNLFHTTLVAHERGKEWIVPRCEQLRDEFPDARFVIDSGGPAAHLIPALKMAAVPLIDAGTCEYADACAGMVDLVDEGRVRHPSVPDLDEAVASARKQKMGDRWKWSRRDSAAPDVSPVVACSLALWAAERRGGVPGVFAVADLLDGVDPADLTDPWGLHGDDDDD